MAFWIELSLFLAALPLLIIGYRKNRRGLLLAGAMVLYASAHIAEFSTGFVEGFRRGYVE
ncbi:MAG TPA: hypothetical protein VFV64_08120 [Permianibacter sp.]|nr:hypothetical protein [Permianibacter sp.]